MSKHLSDRPSLLRRIGSVRLRAFFALGVVGVLGATGTTFAAWTDNVSVAGTTFTAGTIDLKVNGADAAATFPTSLALGTMVPGSSVASLLPVRNNGTAQLKYTATSAVTNADGKGLGTALTYTITAGTVTGSAPSATCSGTAIATGSLGGTVIGSGRLLATGATDTLCVQVTLPGTAPTTLQGATTTVTFTFLGTTDLA